MSLDGYIAGPGGEYDWIAMDPDFDFSEHMAQFDTFLIGRKTFEAMLRMGSDAQPMPGIQNVVVSRTMRPADYPHVAISDDAVRFVTELRAKPGKDIALFGGGELFRSLLAAGLVDRVEMGVMPVLLGGGIPFLPPPERRSSYASSVSIKRPARSSSSTISCEIDSVPGWTGRAFTISFVRLVGHPKQFI